jgi:hypothetical protein
LDASSVELLKTLKSGWAGYQDEMDHQENQAAVTLMNMFWLKHFRIKTGFFEPIDWSISPSEDPALLLRRWQRAEGHPPWQVFKLI